MKRQRFFLCIFTWFISSTSSAEELKFPESWFGSWEGTCQTISQSLEKFSMSLKIGRIEGAKLYQWTIAYQQGESNQIRPYLLVPTKNPNKYIIDEQNSIMLRQDFHKTIEGEKLIGIFQVQTSLIHAVYTRNQDEMVFSLITFNTKDLAQSGGGTGVPTVIDWGVVASQTCILKRL